jgi:CBS domain-containing protein
MTPTRPNTCPRLPVRTQEVIDPDGDASETATVYCPRREASTDVEVCRRCERLSKVVEDADDKPLQVVCWSKPDVEGPQPPVQDPLVEARVLMALMKVAVHDVMTRGVLCVRREMSLTPLAQLMLSRGVSALPVVNDKGAPIGLVSRTDLVRAAYVDGSASSATVRDVMTVMTFSIGENERLDRAAALLAYEGIQHLPVVSGNGSVVGILSAIDVLSYLARREGYVIPEHPPLAPPR